MYLNLVWWLEVAVFAGICAVVAVAYFRALDPGDLLSGWAAYVNDLYYRLTVYRTTADRLPKDTRFDVTDPSAAYKPKELIPVIVYDRYDRYKWALKPVISCEKCIAGQLTFWACLFGGIHNVYAILFAVSLASILATYIYRKVQ